MLAGPALRDNDVDACGGASGTLWQAEQVRLR